MASLGVGGRGTGANWFLSQPQSKRCRVRGMAEREPTRQEAATDEVAPTAADQPSPDGRSSKAIDSFSQEVIPLESILDVTSLGGMRTA